MCPEQSAIGSMCETGCLFGWKWMAEKLIHIYCEVLAETHSKSQAFNEMLQEIKRILNKENYFHYFDIRNTSLNEKGWRRSFSINQLLYGMILYTAKNGDFESFDDIMSHLKETYGENNNE